MKIDLGRLEKELSIAVVATVATRGEGMDILRGRIEEYAGKFC
jgi:Fe2+ transport system protein B